VCSRAVVRAGVCMVPHWRSAPGQTLGGGRVRGSNPATDPPAPPQRTPFAFLTRPAPQEIATLKDAAGAPNKPRPSGATLPAGTLTGDYLVWDAAASNWRVGSQSVGIGGSVTTGLGSVALGYQASAAGNGSVALGPSASAAVDGSVALGLQASATGDVSVALGYQASATGDVSVALGYLASATSFGSVALGLQASATGDVSVALGLQASATGDFSVALGNRASATDANAIVLAAAGSPVNSAGPGTFVVKPVRSEPTAFLALSYNTGTGEITHASSSRRYKTDIADVTPEAAEAAWRLRPVTYRAAGGEPDARPSYGLIAEEVAEVDPLLVYKRTNETTGEAVVEGVLYDRVAPLLLAATRSLKAQVEAQAAELAELKQRLDALVERGV